MVMKWLSTGGSQAETIQSEHDFHNNHKIIMLASDKVIPV